MKISTLILPATLVLCLFAACEEESRPRERTDTANRGENRFGSTPTDGTATDFVDTAPTPTPTPEPVVTDQQVIEQTAPTPTPTPATTAAPARDIPYGTPVPGKAGFVTSPHAPYAGYVDVRGFPPNTEVKDPYSGKIFLVP